MEYGIRHFGQDEPLYIMAYLLHERKTFYTPAVLFREASWKNKKASNRRNPCTLIFLEFWDHNFNINDHIGIVIKAARVVASTSKVAFSSSFDFA